MQAEAIEAATTSLLAGLQSLTDRLAALSGPVADTGVSAQPPSIVPLLGSVDEDADAPSGAEMTAQRPVPAGNHAIVNDPTEVDGFGVTVTSATPPNSVQSNGASSTGALSITCD
jgi:hypothetical protein